MSKKWIFALLGGLAVTATIVVLAVSNFTSAPAPAPTPEVSEVTSRADTGSVTNASASIGEDPFKVIIKTTGAVPEEPVDYTLTLSRYESETAPMPEGSTGGKYDLVVKLPAKEGDQHSFPPITFNNLGTFKYILELTAVSHPEAVWDKTVKYTLTMTVIRNEKDNKLEIVPSIRNKDGEKIPGPIEFDVDYPLTDLTVRKVWDDGDDRLGIRPKSLTVTLTDSAGAKVTDIILNADNGWTATVQAKPGQTYVWTEESIDGYVQAGEPVFDPDTRTTTFTNTLKNEFVKATVKKVWDDKDNKDGFRPDAVTMNLLRREAGTEGVYLQIESVELSETNGWTATVEQPAFVDGVRMEYAWEEQIPEHYTETHVITGDASDFTVIFTNTLNAEMIKATVKKVWDDANNRDHKRPDKVIMKLMCRESGTDGEFKLVESVELNEANGWTATVEKPALVNGVRMEYVWEEQIPEYYTETHVITGDNSDFTFTFTNKLADKYIVVKKWEDKNDPNARPLYITVYATGDGKTYSQVLNDATSWRAEFDLPLYDQNGKEINYVWSESNTPGYTMKLEKTENVITITNTRKPNPGPGPSRTPTPSPVPEDAPIIPLGVGPIYINVGDCLE